MFFLRSLSLSQFTILRYVFPLYLSHFLVSLHSANRFRSFAWVLFGFRCIIQFPFLKGSAMAGLLALRARFSGFVSGGFCSPHNKCQQVRALRALDSRQAARPCGRRYAR